MIAAKGKQADVTILSRALSSGAYSREIATPRERSLIHLLSDETDRQQIADADAAAGRDGPPQEDGRRRHSSAAHAETCEKMKCWVHAPHLAPGTQTIRTSDRTLELRRSNSSATQA